MYHVRVITHISWYTEMDEWSGTLRAHDVHMSYGCSAALCIFNASCKLDYMPRKRTYEIVIIVRTTYPYNTT